MINITNRIFTYKNVSSGKYRGTIAYNATNDNSTAKGYYYISDLSY